jgi:hypothetical protein
MGNALSSSRAAVEFPVAEAAHRRGTVGASAAGGHVHGCRSATAVVVGAADP